MNSTKLKDGLNQNLKLITQLIGQICFNRFEEIYWSKIGSMIHENAKIDLIWRKIGRRLIKQQNTFYLENLMKLLILNSDHYEQIEWYLGFNLDESKSDHESTIKYLLTNKFLLINHFSLDKQILIDNIIGYLANFKSNWFKQTLHQLISIWSNGTLIRHQTKDQHFYLCRILVCCIRFMIRLEIKMDKDQFQSMILHAAEIHLRIIELDKRNRGLFVVEKLINYLNETKLEDKLDFEIELNDEIDFLIGILDEKKKVRTKKETIKNYEKENDEKENEMNYDFVKASDDDDDLIPYDLSNDTPLLNTKKPIYLKDCLEGLTNEEDLEFNSICIQSLADLIEKNTAQASELAVDFIRVLLFSNNEDKELIEIRFKTMVKLCCLNPLDSANYLTKQVYDRNLTINRKMEVLDLIVDSARELSSLENRKSIEDTNQIRSIHNIVRVKRPEYEKIIEDRLKSKTKMICSSHKLPMATKNAFQPFVNQFFYPLINNYDHKDVTLRFDEDDYFVLGKLMLTLAELIKSVSQTHLTRKMSIALIDFLNVFKNHPESYVRKSITICIHSILTNVPNYFLFEDLQTDLLSLRDFLINLKQLDPETFHSHGVLTLYTLEEQINDYQNKIRTDEKIKRIQITN